MSTLAWWMAGIAVYLLSSWLWPSWYDKVALWIGGLFAAAALADVGLMSETAAIAVVAALCLLWHSVLIVRQDVVRERKIAVDERRREARYLRRLGYDTVPPWTIDKPTAPVLRDPLVASQWEETKRRRQLGEME